MPEGVEVLYSANLLRPLVIGKKIATAQPTINGRYKNVKGHFHPDLGPYLFNPSASTQVEKVEVKGKFMYWTFSKEDKSKFWMLNSYGMSGQWGPTKGKHPCFVFEFTDGTQAYFNDPRHFGTIKFTDNYQALKDKINNLGWDPLLNTLEEGVQFVTPYLNKSKKPIAQVLMDQSLFAGVGNYIKCESLYIAKISPWKLCNTFSLYEIKLLCQSIIDVMKSSYEYQGATFLTYKNVYGEEGKYSGQFKVYGKKVDPFGYTIIKESTPDHRTTPLVSRRAKINYENFCHLLYFKSMWLCHKSIYNSQRTLGIFPSAY